MQTRRDFLRSGASLAGAGSALALLPASIRRALAIPAARRTGTIRDVEHIVIFMQENRSFDHYFGALAGVRGFGDRFPAPAPDSPDARHRTVWAQYNDRPEEGAPHTVLPFHLDTREAFETMRVASTPHTWSNAQDAWDAGRMGNWPAAKKNHSMAYFTEDDMPFQYAMARAFTVCDAYHCSFTGGTNTNRLFLWTGTNDGLGRGNGPALGNLYNKLSGGDPAGGYTWTTYPERLEAAGVSWRIYQDMADNYSLNPMAGFKAYRDAYHGAPGSQPALKEKALTTRGLDLLRQDERAGLARALPQTVVPAAPLRPDVARQPAGTRPSRPLPYALQAHAQARDGRIALRFENTGRAGAVFHVYDRLDLQRGPRRYTVEAGKSLQDAWPAWVDGARYDLWVLGPNGFHRHCCGRLDTAAQPPLEVTADHAGPGAPLRLTVSNPGPQTRAFRVEANAYGYPAQAATALAAGEAISLSWDMARSAGWYDVTVRDESDPAYVRRLAGRIETGAPSTSDPAMGGEPVLRWTPAA